MIVELEKLKIHSIHSEIYAANEFEDLKQSIQESGLLEKIVVNNSNELVILSGVRRFHALKELGYTETDVIVRNTSTDDEPLTVISFNKQRQKKASEILNEVEHLKLIWSAKRGRKSANDDTNEKVDTRARISQAYHISAGNISKLEQIKDKSPELIAKIDQGDLSINQAHKIVDIQEKRKKVIDLNANLPEVISNDYYKIFNKSSDDLSDIPDESVQMVFTSPPYWQKRVYSNDENELGSEKTPEEYINRLADHLYACYRVLKPGGSLYLNLGDTFVDKCLQSIPHRVQLALSKKGFILQNTIIWLKKNPLPGNGNLTSSYEFIFHMVKSKRYLHHEILAPVQCVSTPKVTLINRKGSKVQLSDYGNVNITGLKEGKKLQDFWTSSDIVYTAVANQAAVKKYGGTDHPAPFPSEICILPILQSTNPGDTVLDLFSGSGTTGEVALLLGRKYIGYEMNPSYNKLQVARLDDAIAKYNQAELKKAA